MSELNRLRELAALLQPKPVTEARVKTRADLEKKFDSVQATVTDLADDLSEGGVLETLLDDVGMSDHKDAAGLLKTLDSAVKTIQSALMEVEGLLFSAMTESRHPGPVTEMAKASEYRGGAFDRKRAKQMIASFKGKEDTFELEDGSEYEATKMASGGNLKKGDVVFAVHDKYNTGAELYEILGFGKDDKVVYDSMKDVYAKTGVKTLKELEKFNDANDDKEVRMIVKDLDDGSRAAGHTAQVVSRCHSWASRRSRTQLSRKPFRSAIQLSSLTTQSRSSLARSSTSSRRATRCQAALRRTAHTTSSVAPKTIKTLRITRGCT
jgi:hypothetical protein